MMSSEHGNGDSKKHLWKNSDTQFKNKWSDVWFKKFGLHLLSN